MGWMVVAALLARASVLDSPRGSDPRARFRFAFSLFTFFLVLLVATAVTATLRGSGADELRVVTGLVGTLAGVGLVSVVVFEGVVRRFRPNIPVRNHRIPMSMTRAALLPGSAASRSDRPRTASRRPATGIPRAGCAA